MSVLLIDSMDDLHELLQHEPYVIANFGGEHCFGCELLKPVYDDLAFDMPGLIFAELDLNSLPDAMEDLQIDAMPTLLYFREGKEINRTVGSMGREDLLAAIATLLYE